MKYYSCYITGYNKNKSKLKQQNYFLEGKKNGILLFLLKNLPKILNIEAEKLLKF